MPSYAEVLAALPAFRADVLRSQQSVDPEEITAFRTHGAIAANTPDLNVHATGVGLRIRGGEVVPGDVVLKMYVFDKRPPQELGQTPRTDYDGIPIDVEELPIQVALVGPAAAPANRQRHRPILGGVSTSPLNVGFVGTLGCFLRRRRGGVEELLALSNNHVFADTNSMPVGTPIVQPGPETAPTSSTGIYATLAAFIPIQFSTPNNPVANSFDAAIARVTDTTLVQTGKGSIFGIPNYDPSVVMRAAPGQRVVKSGRTTGITRGLVTAVNVSGVLVNFGTNTQPRIAVFNNTISVRGQGAAPFSRPGDSGSVIIDETTGNPAALLFAGDSIHTTACDLAGVCSQFGAWPI